jgi:hypothetical protein
VRLPKFGHEIMARPRAVNENDAAWNDVDRYELVWRAIWDDTDRLGSWAN